MPEDSAPKSDSKSESKSPNRSEQFAEWILKAMMAGGGAGTFWSLFVSSDLPKAVISAGIGLGAAYVTKLMKPVHEGTEARLERAGKVLDQGIDRGIQRTVETVTQVEKQYLEALKVECYKIDVEGYDLGFKLSLEDVFVPLRIQSPVEQLNLQGALDIWHFLPKRHQSAREHPNRRIVVLAAPGYGKTTLIRYLTLIYATQSQQFNETPPFLPILLRLREIHSLIQEENRLSLPELCAKHFGAKSEFRHLKLAKGWFEEQLKKTTLVMLDGLDEVPKSQRPKVRQWVNDEMKAYKCAQFILTSRPSGFELQPNEPNTPVDIDLRLEVLNFTPDQIRSFIDKWYLAIVRFQWAIAREENRRNPHRSQLDEEAIAVKIQQEATDNANQLSQQVFASAALTDLAKNPLLVTMIAATHKAQAELPRRRVELYGKILDLLLGNRPSVKKTNLTLETTQNKAVLQVLAWKLVQEQRTQFTPKEGTAWIQEALTRCSESFSPKQFWEEMKDTAGLLVEKELGKYEFTHQTFQEYFAAVYAREEGREELILQNMGNDRWEEVICFYAALGNATTIINAGLDRLAADSNAPRMRLIKLINRCKHEGREVDKQTRVRCEQELIIDSGINLEGSIINLKGSGINLGIEVGVELGELTGELLLESRFKNPIAIDDNTALTEGRITVIEYQLFLQAQAAGQFHSQAKQLPLSPNKDQPLIGISWQDARWFCAWLATQASLQLDDVVYDYRLPTEAELQQINDRDSFTASETSRTDLTLRVVREELPNRYKSLLSYLANGRWREADRETDSVMLEVAGRKVEGYLDVESIQKFPCEDLRIIDQLWVKFSGGRFGFSVQKQIFVESGNPLDGQYHKEEWEAFCDRVGWMKNNVYVRYREEVTFETSAQMGHLPVVGVGGWGVVGVGGWRVGRSLLSRKDL
jgi:hypothetical protein